MHADRDRQGLPPALVLTGPTASGKSGVAVELARCLPCEIVSVDSALVYRGMNIGTAKPDAATLASVPHHLVDLLEPTERYSAARFVEDALSTMAAITARGNLPLLTGGTMLYLKALASGIADLPQADAATRSVIDTMAAGSGWPALHDELSRCDPDTAARLDPNDAQRIQRALEVYYLSGEPMSKLLRERPPRPLPYRLIQAALVPSDRSLLHARIETRFDEMLELGLIGELRRLRERHALDPELPSMRCVGYRQAWAYLDGRTSLGQLRSTGIAATRQLAKRQLTWLRSMPEVATFDCLAPNPMGQVLDFFGGMLAD
ncbi:MAG: tRNA (adenosine(37)-N6)-dimethylallyltransferase MiaA [Rhodocyclaceae bacterium]|jgi:tRNA dimethylallyltransferase|nr:tRNA (adenosine(37)-N6)-dimethylallyltransferase MiaA [Rhodocyclaceae bacterium]MCE2979707.1 tRNA (adenosine(37)-N6)-dimethylallyltransferase MiaA [Betaproteobacteria bacterium]MCA3073263.1 tRNA (adenosine(37)-N6)-dimethylallyltransferase MiaA [Rhodocyclaceae bacterium]MCA3090091.1 tRNA (adenosine(37)-N6)-dimethylallyltransferase MiaA [Rhodocyclaceae bacterium]MCA3093905.1 tRNA (adenosine(37)-N6)-dimethylallyltransferase MiaA [Rhodocyclaceae bacterium]